MSEIEKLYENANVEKEWNPLPYGGIDEFYPEFTAEKQLKIIKFILKKHIDVRFVKSVGSGKFYIASMGSGVSCLYKNFDETIASFINNTWQDLTATEKAEIKRILE